MAAVNKKSDAIISNKKVSKIHTDIVVILKQRMEGRSITDLATDTKYGGLYLMKRSMIENTLKIIQKEQERKANADMLAVLHAKHIKEIDDRIQDQEEAALARNKEQEMSL